ncbi:MAG: c-type cytochrome [Sandaracinaceae bacterium]|nr:c-type cytochrome [Sandaracinaceae bacterium]
MRAPSIFALSWCLLASACGTAPAAPDAATPAPDAGVDAAAVPRDAGSDAGTDAGPPEPGDAARGAALYRTYCTLCHGADGQGYAADDAPALNSQDLLRIASDEFLYANVYDGRPGTPMSAWGDAHGGPFSVASARDVVAFLRSWATEPFEDVSALAADGDAGRGAPLFAEHCAECHGERGQGVRAPTLDNPVFQRTATDGFLLRTIERGRRDTPMEGFEDRLTSAQIHDVVAFVRTLRRDPMEEWPIEDPPTLETLVLHPGGEAPTFTLREGRYVPAAEVAAALAAGRRMVLLDARATSDWVLGHIPGAAPFPFFSVDELAGTLPNDGTFIIAYCACPHAASGRVVDDLRARGFASTAILDEGIVHWREAGYPMARGRLP